MAQVHHMVGGHGHQHRQPEQETDPAIPEAAHKQRVVHALVHDQDEGVQRDCRDKDAGVMLSSVRSQPGASSADQQRQRGADKPQRGEDEQIDEAAQLRKRRTPSSSS